jgi:hypothetical protein
VRSSNPYPISLTLRHLKNILKKDENMDVSCFNMAVRILACDVIQLAREIPVHYMDLNYCVGFYNHILHFIIKINLSDSYTNVFLFIFS